MKPVRILLIICLLAMTACIAQPAIEAHASPPIADVVNYTIYKGNNSTVVNTGIILKGDLVTVEVDIVDARATSSLSLPVVALNTASFSIYSSDNIKVTNYVPGTPATFRVTFYNAVYTGIEKSFNFEISYPGSTLPTYSINLPFNQCVPYVAPDKDDPDEGVIVKGTGFVLKDANYGSGTVYAGETFALNATILATNGSVPVENVTVSFIPPEKLTIAAGSSVSYIGTMSPGQSAPVSVSILPGANIDEGTYSIVIDISGINQKTGEKVSAQATVSVPVLQPERFEIFETYFPSDLTVGMDDGMGYATITLVNKGRGTVANVSVEIVGTGLYTDEGKQYVGNVSAGEQKTSDFYLHADTEGQLDGMVIVTYENARGEEKTLERGFSINGMAFMEPDFEEGFPIDEFPPESAAPPRWILILIIVAVAIAAAILLLRRSQKKKKAKEDEFLDEDDDL